MMLPLEICEPVKNEKLLCGLKDFIEKPKGTFAFPFDLIFHGHKDSDVDACHGHVPLRSDSNMPRDAAATSYPLRNWTDADVWNYIEKHDIPIHHDRYEKVEETWRQKEDKRFNHHYMPACTNCLDPENARSVYCPKLKCEVANVSAQYLVPEFKANYMGV